MGGEVTQIEPASGPRTVVSAAAIVPAMKVVRVCFDLIVISADVASDASFRAHICPQIDFSAPI
jgi:hypothetical protein